SAFRATGGEQGMPAKSNQSGGPDRFGNRQIASFPYACYGIGVARLARRAPAVNDSEASRRWRITVTGLALALGLLLPATGTTPASSREQIEFFEQKIRPVLAKHCYRCHSAQATKVRGGLLLDTRDALRKGGSRGAALVPGKPESSLLLKALR